MSNSNRKRHSNEGIGRILKNTLAQAVDSTVHRPKKDFAQSAHNDKAPSRSVSRDDKTDDLNPAALQALLHNIGSHTDGEMDSQSHVTGNDAREDRGQQIDCGKETDHKGTVTEQKFESRRDYNGNDKQFKEKELQSTADSRSEVVHHNAPRKESQNGIIPRQNFEIETVRTGTSDNSVMKNSVIMRSDVMSDERIVEDNRSERFRSRKSEGGYKKDIHRFGNRLRSGGKSIDEPERRALLDIVIEPKRIEDEKDVFEEEMDAYDRWKMKRCTPSERKTSLNVNNNRNSERDKSSNDIRSSESNTSSNADRSFERKTSSNANRDSERNTSSNADRSFERKTSSNANRDSERNTSSNADRSFERKASSNANRDSERNTSSNADRSFERKTSSNANRDSERNSSSNADRSSGRKTSSNANRDSERKTSSNANRDSERKTSSNVNRSSERNTSSNANRSSERNTSSYADRSSERNFSSNANRVRIKCDKSKVDSPECPKDMNISFDDLKPERNISDDRTSKEISQSEKGTIIQTQNFYSSNVSLEQNTGTGKDDEKRETSVDSRNGSFKNESEYVSDDDVAHAESRIPSSSMDKIQNLFESYISPVSAKPERGSTKGILKTSNRKDSSPSSTKTSHGKEDCNEISKHSHSDLQDDLIITENVSPSESLCKEDSNRMDEEQCHKGTRSDIKDHQKDVVGKSDNEDMARGLEDLHITEDKENVQNSRANDKKLTAHHQEFHSEHLPTTNSCKTKYSRPSKLLTKSPTSIPSGFSSDYDVGIISQSQSETEEDGGESPHPCAANLFLSPHPQDASSDTDRKPPIPQQWHRHYGPQSGSHSGPHSHWYHPSLYQYPYLPHQPYSQSMGPHHQAYPHPQSIGFDPSSFVNHIPRSPHSHLTTLTVPAETFGEKESVSRVAEFVNTKMAEWDAFMNQRHGHTVPVDVVINVMLSGTRDMTVPEETVANMPPSRPYPASGWEFPMHQPSMGYYRHLYWQQQQQQHGQMSQHPYGPYAVGVDDDLYTDKEAVAGKSAKESLRTRAPHGYHPSEYHQDREAEGDAMKRRFSSPDRDSDSEVTKKEKTCDRDSKKTKKDHGATEYKHLPSDEKKNGDERERKPNSVSSSRSDHTKNSVSTFLNPNDLKNDWRTPPKVLSSTVTRPSKYGHEANQKYPKERERDRSPQSKSSSHGYLYRKNQQAYIANTEQDDSIDSRSFAQPDVSVDSSLYKSCEDEKSPRVTDRKSRLKELNVDQSSAGDDDRGRIPRKWSDDCSEPRSQKNSPSVLSSSEQFAASPDSGSSFHDNFGSYRRRRSDSVVSYSSEDRSPLPRDSRVCKTPGYKGDRRYREEEGGWKRALLHRSKSYSHQYIDTHCHIDFMYNRTMTPTIPFRKYVEEHADSFPVNYEGCVAIFCNPKVFSQYSQAYSILKLLAKEDKVWVAVGCHPKNATDFRSHHIVRLRHILQDHPRTVALGEIGLDYSQTFYNSADIQKEVFIQQLHLALDLNLPLVIHCRDADKDCLEIMKKTVPAKHKIHLHCFTRHINIARQWMEHFPNLFIGFTPLITYVTAKEATHAAELIPLDRLLLETDAPYFVPTGVPNSQVKGVSHPGFALFTAERLAQIKGVSTDVVLEACRKNTRAMYGI